MTFSENPYDRIMTRLREEMPTLADQLEQEVRRGRALSDHDLREEGRFEEWASRLSGTELSPLGKTDVAVIPYTTGERIELVREALLTLAETMYASRNAILRTAQEKGMTLEVRFGDPELETPSRLPLPTETEAAAAALRSVRGLLADDLQADPEAT